MSIAFPAAPSYVEHRERFLAAARAAGANVTEYGHPLRGPFGESLATDVALLGNPAARRFLITLSGTHGIEGYYGSQCQIDWLQEFTSRPLPDGVAVLMIHLINPWGAAWMRRVNENNIDLNRNYIEFTRPFPHNERYETLHGIYTCKELDGPQRRRADILLAEQIRTLGWSSVMGIVEGGQYAHSDGLFYGGQAPSWSNLTLHDILRRFLAKAEVAMCFDLHTGAGSFGHPMLMAIAESPYPALVEAQSLYGPWLHTLLTGMDQVSETGVAATATGYASQAILNALPHVYLMQCVIECGTYEGEKVHHVLRDDHWLHLHGNPTDVTGRQIKLDLLECFRPADPDWRDITWRRTRQIWERALAALPLITKPSECLAG